MKQTHRYLEVVLGQAERHTTSAQLMRKRDFDVIFSVIVVFFFLSWLIPLLALLIKCESKGPVFFKQLRTGKDGKPFYCLKLRSMVVNSHSDSLQATKADNRVTRVGHFLRRTSMDELPQFINVLRGEMSVVGPRPHMVSQTNYYSEVIHDFMDRHKIMPGITGLAQIAGHRGETKEIGCMDKRVKADLFYIENWSFMLDMKIILLTLAAPLRRNYNAF